MITMIFFSFFNTSGEFINIHSLSCKKRYQSSDMHRLRREVGAIESISQTKLNQELSPNPRLNPKSKMTKLPPQFQDEIPKQDKKLSKLDQSLFLSLNLNQLAKECCQRTSPTGYGSLYVSTCKWLIVFILFISLWSLWSF